MGTDKDTRVQVFNDTKNDEQIIIKRCTLDDLDGVIEVNERELPEDYPYFFYKSIFDNFPESFLIANDKYGTVVAYIMWRVEKTPSLNSLRYVNKGHLVSIAVSESHRRRGIGSMLLSNSISSLKKYKISQYVLEVRVSNYGAIKLYEKFNFKIETIKNNYYRDGENAYYMTLSVNKS